MSACRFPAARIALCGLLASFAGALPASVMAQHGVPIAPTPGRLADRYGGTSLQFVALSASDRRATFTIQRDLLEKTATPTTFEMADVSSILSLTVYTAEQAVVMIRERAGGPPTAALVDLRRGTQLERFTIESPIELRPPGVLLYRTDKASPTYALDVTTAGRTMLTDAQRVMLVLTYGGPFLRVGAIRELEERRDWWGNEAIRRIVRDELARAVQQDAGIAAARAGGVRDAIGAESERRAYFDRLVRLVGMWRDPRFLALLVKADTWSASGALNSLGSEATSSILAALRASTPAGYSPFYKVGLLRALQVIGATNAAVYTRQDVIATVRATLMAPPDWQTLQAAIEFVVEMDEDDLFARVRQLAGDEALVLGLVRGDAEGAQAVVETARLAVERRWVQP